MSNKRKVLILLATYNGQEYIEKQLDTILAQTDVDIEILISDDNSTDNTLSLVNNYVSRNKISILYNEKKAGASSNFFNLIEKCNAEPFDYIAFSDQDDIWYTDKLSTAIDQLENSNCDGFSSDVTAYWPKSNTKKLLKKSYFQTKHDHWFESPGPGCSQVFSKRSFDLFRQFIIKNSSKLSAIDYHDWLVYAFYKHNNLKWIISPYPKMLYRQHDSNVMGSNIGLYSKLLRFKKIQNKWYTNQVITIYELVTNKEFNEFIKFEKLKSKPLSLRRQRLYSLVVWILIIIGFLKHK